MFHVKQSDFLTIKAGSQVFVSIRKYFKNYPSYKLASVQDSVQDNVQDEVNIYGTISPAIYNNK